ncbi:hypothetical protein ACIQKB_35845 [Streptomyces sp. NPDC092046]|uniref:hypothetical protein n=1 Tax=Streptomyces sp. NPDC092046 TaxID=3366009 RepID=UPI0037FDAFAC
MERRHEVVEGVVDITEAYLATEPYEKFTDGANAFVRRALAEYLVPGSAPDAPGLRAA